MKYSANLHLYRELDQSHKHTHDHKQYPIIYIDATGANQGVWIFQQDSYGLRFKLRFDYTELSVWRQQIVVLIASHVPGHVFFIQQSWNICV
jgi:hypothetical protein